MTTTEALLLLIGIIVLFYVSAGLVWQWWSGELDEPADRTRGRDYQEGFHDE